MKILIVGIDALGYHAIDVFGLDRLKTRLQQSKHGNPKIVSNSNHSRGWPELYTGKNAYKTGAFYPLPLKKDGKIEAYVRTGLSFIKSIIDPDVFLWNRLNKLGLSCGLFNVNTVDEVQSINGFCVPGTMAGYIEMNKRDVFPQNATKYLNLTQLDLGLRMGFGGTLPMGLWDLECKVNDHLSGFFFLLEHLIERFNPDACFAHSPLMSELIFKFMKLCIESPKDSFARRLKDLVCALAHNFDCMLDDFIKAIRPTHLFIVSDHGSSPLDFHVNLNEILFRCGLIKRRKKYFSKMRRTLKYIIHSMIGAPHRPAFPQYDLNSSQYFNLPPSDLIYLNDERFLGPKFSYTVAKELSKKVADQLNRYVHELGIPMWFEALNLGKYLDEKDKKVPLPDIRCHLPDNYANTGRTRFSVCIKNEVDYSKDFFKKGFWGDHAGTYGSDTLCLYQGPRPELVTMKSLGDIYKSIIKVASAC